MSPRRSTCLIAINQTDLCSKAVIAMNHGEARA
jgi:hypothetical protein